jgi:hypothetical protein
MTSSPKLDQRNLNSLVVEVSENSRRTEVKKRYNEEQTIHALKRVGTGSKGLKVCGGNGNQRTNAAYLETEVRGWAWESCGAEGLGKRKTGSESSRSRSGLRSAPVGRVGWF